MKHLLSTVCLPGSTIQLADTDQEQRSYLPVGGRAHTHLYLMHNLSEGSANLDLMRLDARRIGGTAEKE